MFCNALLSPFMACVLGRRRVLILTLLLMPGALVWSLSPDDAPTLPPEIRVTGLAEASDGSVYLSGFDLPVANQRIVRLRPDGSVDPGFVPSPPIDDWVRRVQILDNGQILAIVDGDDSDIDRILRLHPDGEVDTTFNAPGFIGFVLQTLALPDGRLLVAGNFRIDGIVGRRDLFLLNANGTVDPSFAPVLSAPFGSSVRTLVRQEDGRLLIGGRFDTVNGVNRRNLARLNPDGSLDTGFRVDTDDRVSSIALRADGSFMVIGSFDLIAGQSRQRIALVSREGTVLPGFSPASSGTLNEVVVLPDGHILLRGESLQISGITGLVRLRPDGSVDSSFSLSPDRVIQHARLDLSGTRLLVAGSFLELNGMGVPGFARVSLEGRVQRSLAPLIGGGGEVLAVATLAGGDLLAGGSFTQVDGVARPRLARFRVDGELVNEFNPAPDGTVRSVLALPDGGSVVAGDFSQIDGQVAARLARLDDSGALKAGFQVSVDGPVNLLALDDQGRLLIGGDFNQVNGQARTNLARLTLDGDLDTAFSPATNQPVSSLAVDLQGRILIGGGFSTVNGQARQHLARLLPDGQLDANFAPAVDGEVGVLLVLPDGRVVAGGTFSTVNGQLRAGLARLSASGILDAGFAPNPDGPPSSLVALANGQLLVAGRFARIASTVVNCCLARLNSDGSLDAGLQAGLNSGTGINALAVQGDGQILIGGDFLELGGQVRPRLARLQASGPRPDQRVLLTQSGARLEWRRTQGAKELSEVRFEISDDGLQWSPLGAGVRSAQGWSLANPMVPQGELFFVRASGLGVSGAGNGSATLQQQILQAWENDRVFTDRFEPRP